MARNPETYIKNKLFKFLNKEIGGWHLKITGSPYMRRGTPDIISCINSMFICFEVKTPKSKLRKTQKIVLNKITTEGKGWVFVVFDWNDAIASTLRLLFKKDKA